MVPVELAFLGPISVTCQASPSFFTVICRTRVVARGSGFCTLRVVCRVVTITW